MNDEIKNAIENRDITLLRKLLNSNNVNNLIIDGNSPLHYAVICNDKEVVSLLVKNFKADVNLANAKGDRPIFIAARMEKLDLVLVSYLLKNGANVYEKNSAGRNVLEEVTYYGQVEMVKFFIKNGFIPSTKSINDYYAYDGPLKFTNLLMPKYLLMPEDERKFGYLCSRSKEHESIKECITKATSDRDEFLKSLFSLNENGCVEYLLDNKKFNIKENPKQYLILCKFIRVYEKYVDLYTPKFLTDIIIKEADEHGKYADLHKHEYCMISIGYDITSGKIYSFLKKLKLSESINNTSNAKMSESFVAKIDKYINDNLFWLKNVCKEISKNKDDSIISRMEESSKEESYKNTTNLSSLPPEIINKICSYLKFDDIKNPNEEHQEAIGTDLINHNLMQLVGITDEHNEYA